MDKQREDFEKWWHKECCHLEGSDEASFVRYVSWEAWKASRAAIVVELPEKDDLSLAGDESTKFVIKFRNSAIDECTDSIRAAGLSIKEANQ